MINLKNFRDELLEDLSEIEEAIENNTLEIAREVLHKKSNIESKRKMKSTPRTNKISPS